MVLGQGGRILGVVPHAVDDFGLRLPLIVPFINLLSGLVARASTSRYLLFNVNLSLHPAFRRRQVLKNLIVPLIFAYAKCLLNDVLILVVRRVDVQRRARCDLLHRAFGRELLLVVTRIDAQEGRSLLVDHLRLGLQSVTHRHIVWRSRLRVYWQLAILEIYLLVRLRWLRFDGLLLRLGYVLVEHVCPGGRCKRLIDKRSSKSTL